MNVAFHWFGIAWLASTAIGVLAAAVVVGVAIGPVRRVSARASTLVVVAGTLAMVCLMGEVAFRGVISNWISRSTDGDLGLRVLDAWTIARPVLEGVAMAMLGGAMWVLAKARR